MYSINGEELKPIHDWVQMFERFWTQHIDRIKERAERAAQARPSPGNHRTQGEDDADSTRD